MCAATIDVCFTPNSDRESGHRSGQFCVYFSPDSRPFDRLGVAALAKSNQHAANARSAVTPWLQFSDFISVHSGVLEFTQVKLTMRLELIRRRVFSCFLAYYNKL